MVKAAFTGSFDPFHSGHQFVVDQALRLGFEVYIIVANNVSKTYEKDLEQRVNAVRDIFYKNIKVVVLGSDADNIGVIMNRMGINVIVRGIRNDKDYHYEEAITEYNRRVNGLETIYFPAPNDLKGVSSTAIKGQLVCPTK